LRRVYRHLTLRYITSRLGVMLNEILHKDAPWLVPEAVRFLDNWLVSSDMGFEWGSGRSTTWFAKRTMHLSSVESSKDWFNRVRATIDNQGLTNVQYRFCCTDGIEESVAGDSDYVNAIEGIPNDSLDYVLVDGWARDYCTLASLGKLKIGGILVIDNANWFLVPPDGLREAPSSRCRSDGPLNDRWTEVERLAASWRKFWSSNGVINTLVMVRPPT
jgi:hypothetical protein